MKIKLLGVIIAIAVFLPACSAHTEIKMENIDTSYSTGSTKADKELAEYIEAAKKGSPFAHAYLAKVYCGELCLTPRSNAYEGSKEIMHDMLHKLQSLGIEPDYVKSYSHYILSDNFKINYKSNRIFLEKHMTKEQVDAAKNLAKIWQQQEKIYQVSNKKGE